MTKSGPSHYLIAFDSVSTWTIAEPRSNRRRIRHFVIINDLLRSPGPNPVGRCSRVSASEVPGGSANQPREEHRGRPGAETSAMASEPRSSVSEECGQAKLRDFVFAKALGHAM